MAAAPNNVRLEARSTTPAPLPEEWSLDLVLDLVNSRGPDSALERDRLRTPAELVGWLAAHGWAEERLEGLRRSPPDASLLLRDARRLREDLASALEALRDRRPVAPEVIHALDRLLAERRAATRLRRDGDRLRISEEETSGSLRALLSPVARAAAELLSGCDPGRVRRCAAPECGAWFLDTSKSGRRRWCSMATCGNRAKAARHRKRRRAG
jgi:predicted RNA-binding Zn ribbon-like protein